VVAIISLLIGILVPSLSAARNHAKNVRTRATLKSIGDGLEMFRGENEDEVRQTGGYPPSAWAEDETEPGQQRIFGAQWMVRYLVGKDLRGFVPRRNVPPDILAMGTEEGFHQKQWYDDPNSGYVSNIGRAGPYVQVDGLKLVQPSKLPGAPKEGMFIDDRTMAQLVAVDSFGYPILYYAANVRLAERGRVLVGGVEREVPLASFDGTNPGIYTMMDNGLFTGACKGSACTYPPWDFQGVLGGTGQDTQGYYKLAKFGEFDPPDPNQVAADVHTFPYYILNRNAYEASGKRTVLPARKESYLLITAGRDGNYGTRDDVTNFE